MKKLIFFAAVLLASISASARQQQQVEMADALRQSGKIYVVIGTIFIIFLGLAIYLFTMDRRLKKLEKNKDI